MTASESPDQADDAVLNEDESQNEEPVTPAPPRLELREPLTPVVETQEALDEMTKAIAAATGPVALDAERASGFRYSQRAYLVQIRREGAGSALIDPIAFDDLSQLNEAISDAEWILHAASQDLMCFAEIGMRPKALFDTELAGRLLNLPRVGLATLVETQLGRSLAKEHSAADWSTRPLPAPWLHYAALDVEVLIELRDILHDQLVETGKRDWAAQEFEALLSFTGPSARQEPWRRTSGIHKARGRRALGIVRSLWEARDAIAADRDITPGRILPDSAILEIAQAMPKDLSTLKGLRSMRNRGPRRFLSQWHDAVEQAMGLAEKDLPTVGQRFDGPPPPRSWADKNPAAAARLGACRELVARIAETHNLPTENLISPGALRALAWEPPAEHTTEAVSAALASAGARQWQIDLAAEGLATALDASPAEPAKKDSDGE
ncbi:MAG: ribonuclease D [Aeromicrobium sp.]